MKRFLARFIYWIFGTVAFYFVVYYPESLQQPLIWNALFRSMLAISIIIIIGDFMGSRFRSK